MIKQIISISLLFQSMVAFGQIPFTIKGRIDAPFPQKIEISYLGRIDSVISSNGEFSFKGEIAHPTLVIFSATDLASRKFVNRDIFVERGSVNLYSPFNTLRSAVPEMEVSTSQRILDTYNGRFALLIDMHRFTSDSIVRKNESPDIKRVGKKLAQKIYSFEELYERDFITQNTSNYVGAYFFYRYGSNFMEENEIDSVYNLFTAQVKNSFYLRTVEEKLRYSRLLKEGKTFTAIVLKDPKQNDVAVRTQFTSKLTLIDVWASWCVPCIETHALLKDLYSKYSKNGFNVIGVSIDDKRESWMKYLNKGTVPWKNLIDPKGAKGEINKMFNLESGNGIPFFIFVNEKGEYVGINVEAEELEEFVKNYLKI